MSVETGGPAGGGVTTRALRTWALHPAVPWCRTSLTPQPKQSCPNRTASYGANQHTDCQGPESRVTTLSALLSIWPQRTPPNTGRPRRPLWPFLLDPLGRSRQLSGPQTPGFVVDGRGGYFGEAEAMTRSQTRTRVQLSSYLPTALHDKSGNQQGSDPSLISRERERQVGGSGPYKHQVRRGVELSRLTLSYRISGWSSITTRP